MALKSATTSNYLKFSGRTGEWSWSGEPVQHPVFLCDLANLAEGWIHLEKGKRPIRLFDPDGGFPPPPHPEAKQGILVRVKMQGVASGVGELTLSQGGALKALDRLHDQYVAEREKHKDQVPIVGVAGREQFGLAWAPVLRLQGWAPRPVDLPCSPPYKPDEAWDRDAVVDPTDALDPDDGVNL